MAISRVKMNQQEKRWRAEDDLRVLKAAEQIKSDPERVRMAAQVFKEEKAALEKAEAALKFKTTKRAKLLKSE